MRAACGDECVACIEKIPDGCRQLVPTVRDRCISWISRLLPIVIVGVGAVLLFFIIPAAIFHRIEGWSYEGALYYCFVTLLTIGFGDLVAGKQFLFTHVCRSDGRSVARSIDRSIDQSINQSIDRSIDQSIVQLYVVTHTLS